MEFDIKTLIIGLLLGIISGVGFANIFGIDWWNEISSVGSFLGGIAGLGALMVAYAAYKKWQRATDYSIFLEQYKNLAENINEIFDSLEEYIFFRELETFGVDLNQLTNEDIRKHTRLTKDLRKLFTKYHSTLNLISLALPKGSELASEMKKLLSLQKKVNRLKDKPTDSLYSEYDKLGEAQILRELFDITVGELMVKGQGIFRERH